VDKNEEQEEPSNFIDHPGNFCALPVVLSIHPQSHHFFSNLISTPESTFAVIPLHPAFSCTINL
jgi:hypothetical protein